MDRKKKVELYFAGYFVVFPIIFIVSSFLWRAMILNKEFTMVASDALSILGIYYLITSLICLENIKSLLS
ncbi:hypothetical protein [Pradoshia sp.]